MNMINISVAGGVPSPVEGACGALTIGNVGDNGATGVLLDFTAWAEEYGAGAVTLGVRRKGDAAWYPVALTVTGGAAVWIVSNVDTAAYGIGEARFAYTVGEVEKRSAVFRFFVDRGLGAPEGTPPDPYEDWVERLEDLGAETLQNAQDAAGSASEAQGYAGDAEAAKNAAEAAQAAAESSQEDAEAWAVGERDGEPVPETDPTFENNAKYYAGLASASEIAAKEAADAAEHSVTDAAEYVQEASDYARAADQSARDALGYASDAETQAEIATNKAEESAGHAQEAEDYSEDSEAWAVGKRGGVDVPQDDPAYNNNALFYARAAEDGAKTSGYAWFDVDNEDGLLYVTFTSNQDQNVDFELDINSGELEVVFT